MLNKKKIIIGMFIGSSLFASTAIGDIIDSNESKTNMNNVSEVLIKNQEPINVSIVNFPVSKDIQNVEIKNQNPISVEIENEVVIKKPEQNKIVLLNQSTNTLIVESSATLGKISSSLQDISVSKVQVVSQGVLKDGLKIKMVADDDLEVSKDIKVLVENTSYIDIEEMKSLSDSIKVMLEYSKKDLKNKDFKLSWNSKNDLSVSLYTIDKMFGAMKGIEISMIIGKNEKFPSKAVLSVKELEEFKSYLDNYEKIIISK